MTTVEFLSYLQSLDVKLWLDGDGLRYSAPKGVLTSALRTELGARKAEILMFLREAHSVVHSTAPPIQSVSRDAVVIQDHMLAELEGLSDEEAQRLLADENP